MPGVSPVLHLVGPVALYTLLFVAFFAILDGLDDLWLNVAWLWLWLTGRLRSDRPQPPGPERRIAIFLPLWREDRVVFDMLAHNIAAIRYPSYDIFAGVYPNDELTLEAVRRAESVWSNVHMAVCPHDGPTSKPDCLNWIYQQMLLFEESSGAEYDAVVIHDAEDIIHPEELRVINAWSGDYDFVQIPVLQLATPIRQWIRGVYSDEFALVHSRDLAVRSAVGGFVPSAGVGTAYTRRALDVLARAESNRVFEPGSLTEDYENGFRLNQLGLKQAFVSPGPSSSGPVATREYFPETWRKAVHQRSRWLIGIAFQAWEQHGWGAGWQRYWLWRDRKGLIANPIAAVGLVLFFWCLSTRFWSRIEVPPWLQGALLVSACLQLLRMLIRIGCSWRFYGPRFALFEPVREPVAVALNIWATALAFRQYFGARWNHRPVVWLKTEHAFPNRAALLESRRRLGEILTGSGYLEPPLLEDGLRTKPESKRIGEWLVELGRISEGDLYDALAIQSGCERAEEISGRNPAAFMALPARIVRKWRILPFDIRLGELHVAMQEPPSSALERDLQLFTSLKVRFHLVTPAQFSLLAQVELLHLVPKGIAGDV